MENYFIGGADGPTAILLAGKLGIGWLNIFGLIILILILIPNIIYAFTKGKGQKNKCTNTVMNILEQIALAVIPTVIFLLCGITLGHILLIVFAVIFGIAHVYVTTKNRVD